MAKTLLEQVKLAIIRDETLKATIIEIYVSEFDLLQYLPFENVGKIEMLDGKACAINFNNEPLTIISGDIDTDAFLARIFPDKHATNEVKQIKLLVHNLAKTLITGLQTRCSGSQLINNINNSDGAPLSITQLDNLIKSVDNPTHLLMSKVMYQRVVQYCDGSMQYTSDAFGRKVAYYNDLPILIVDKDNNYDEILPFDNEGTSIYCLSLGEDGIIGLQNGEMEVKDLGEIDEKPIFRTRIEWLVGLNVPNKAIARLQYIIDGKMTK